MFDLVSRTLSLCTHTSQQEAPVALSVKTVPVSLWSVPCCHTGDVEADFALQARTRSAKFGLEI